MIDYLGGIFTGAGLVTLALSIAFGGWALLLATIGFIGSALLLTWFEPAS